MKKQNFRILYLIGIACFTSCSSEVENARLTTDLPMELMAQVSQVNSRATSDNLWTGDGTETVSVSDGNKTAAYKIINREGDMEAVDTKNQLYWASATTPQSVQAWYPATADNQPVSAWTVQADQSAGGFQQSDLLYTSTEVALQGNKKLFFRHATAKVIVHLHGNGSNDAELEGATISIKNSMLTGTMTSGSLTASGSTLASIIPKAMQSPDGYIVSCQALMIPQLIHDVPFIVITTKSGTVYEYIPKGENGKLEGTCQNIYYITVGKPGISVVVEKSSSQWGSEGDEEVNAASL